MRVLFVNRMASLVRGGGETFDLEMARHLAGLGVEVSFLTGLPLCGRARLTPADWWPSGLSPSQVPIASFHIRTPYMGWFPWDRVRGGWRLRWWEFVWFERAAARWVWRRRAQFDVIQVCELPTFVRKFKARGAGPPVVMRLTAPDFHDPGGVVRQADALVASGTTMRKMREGLRPDCENIPNGVDPTVFRPHTTPVREREGWGKDGPLVLFVARFQAVKNHAMLLDAFRRLLADEPRARLVLAGRGPLEAEVRAQVAALGIAPRVSFLGEMSFRALADLYAAADINVISSDYESFSFAALEGMASGLPHVVTSTEWVPTLVGGRGGVTTGREDAPGGFVVPRGDPAAFHAALRDLWRDPSRRRRMGEWNRQRVEREFGWEASARRLLGVYQRITGGG